MKTSEEVKKGILCDGPCNDCPYKVQMMSDSGCSQAVADDTLALIQQFERERNALLDVIRGDCCICANYKECVENDFAIECNYPSCWQWRGVQVVE